MRRHRFRLRRFWRDSRRRQRKCIENAYDGQRRARVGDATLATRDLATIHTDVPFPTYRGGFPPASGAGLATADGVTLGKIGETVNGRPNTSTHFAYDEEALERTFGTARYSDSGFFVDVNQTAHPSSYPPATVRT